MKNGSIFMKTKNLIILNKNHNIVNLSIFYFNDFQYHKPLNLNYNDNDFIMIHNIQVL